jgi:hypothetical protein
VSPADAWTVTLYALGQYAFNVAASAQTATGDWLFSYSSTNSANILPGSYRYEIRGVLAGTTYRLAQGAVTVLPNASATAGSDQRTFNEIALANIEAAMAGRWSAAVKAYQIHGRALTYFDPAELSKLRTQYRWLVWKERNPGKHPGMQVTFIPPR